MKDRVAQIIQDYDAQGIHRTATSVDETSGKWLEQRIQHLDLVPEVTWFDTARVDIGQAYLEIGGTRIEGVPCFDCSYTGAAGVTGKAGEIGSAAEIGVIMAPPFDAAPGTQQVMQARRAAKHRAIVVVTSDDMPADGAALLNAEHFREPMGPPVLQVANEAWQTIRNAAEQQQTITVMADCERHPARACNVSTTIAGSDTTLAPLIVMTPRSGWWRCASERGGGIAVWLEIMRALATSTPRRTTLFTANTGHELGHTGLDYFLETRAEIARNADFWIHLGANFAASRGGHPRLQYSDNDAQQAFAPILADLALQDTDRAPIGPRPAGEARNVFDLGGRYVSLLGGNHLFHHPADIYPDAVDVDRTVSWCQAFVRLARELTSQGSRH